jgi:hypothetical protein
MTTFNIISKSNANHGDFEGATPAEALAAMHRDAGYRVSVEGDDVAFASDADREVCGGVDDWTIRQVVWHIEERDARGGWQLTADGECATEAEAERYAESLEETYESEGLDDCETRVRRVVG